MNGRLYRLTPAGGKPNHYTDSYASALAVLGTEGIDHSQALQAMEVGESLMRNFARPVFVERVA